MGKTDSTTRSRMSGRILVPCSVTPSAPPPRPTPRSRSGADLQCIGTANASCGRPRPQDSSRSFSRSRRHSRDHGPVSPEPGQERAGTRAGGPVRFEPRSYGFRPGAAARTRSRRSTTRARAVGPRGLDAGRGSGRGVRLDSARIRIAAEIEAQGRPK